MMASMSNLMRSVSNAPALDSNSPECHVAGCPGGCMKRDERTSTEGIVCNLCGKISSLHPGQCATGRMEFEQEKNEFAQSMRLDRLEELNGPMTRVIHAPLFANCRICTVRSVELIAKNRILAAPFVAWVKFTKHDPFHECAAPFLKKLEDEVKANTKMCESNSYADGNSNMRSSGKTALNDLNRLVERVIVFEQAPVQAETTASAMELDAVPGLEDYEDDNPPIESKYVSEGKVVDGVKEHCRTVLSGVSTQTAFKVALRSIKEKCKYIRTRNSNSGKGAAAFVLATEDPCAIRVDPLIKRVLDGTAPTFPTPELNAGLAVRSAKFIQSVAESMLERIAQTNGIEYAKALVTALTDKKTSPSGAAQILDDHAIDASYALGAARKSTFLYKRRMCCDNAECMQKMCMGRSNVFGVSTSNKDGVWTLQTRMLGAFAMCVGRSSHPDAQRLATRMAFAASKELFLQSSFFATRQSEFIATCTTLMALHGSKVIKEKSEQQVLKHDLSVQAIAIAMGFWPRYFGACFEPIAAFFNGQPTVPEMSVRVALTQFTTRVSERMAAFESEKGNAAIDAVLLYRRVLYMHHVAAATNTAAFASSVQRGGGAATVVPNLPSDVFGKDVDLKIFAVTFTSLMKFASNSNRANSSQENQLVRRSEYSDLTYDALLSCIRGNRLGVGTYYEAEAGQRSLDHEQFAAIDKPNRESSDIATAVPRAHDICRDNILTLADCAADRVECCIPGFWGATWTGIDQLESVTAEQTILELGHHPAGALLKRIDNRHYVHSGETARGVHVAPAVIAHPLSAPGRAASAAPLRNLQLDSSQRLLDLEVGLSVLMHGVNKVKPPLIGSSVTLKRMKADAEMVIASLLESKSWTTVLPMLYDVPFLSSVVEFCDSAAKRAMEASIQNLAPSQDPEDCPVIECAEAFFHSDAYVSRACRLHVQRLQKLVTRKVVAKGSLEYYESGQAQEDVMLDGERGTPSTPKAKRTVSSQHAAALARAACNGYDLVKALVGPEWIENEAFDMKVVLNTTHAVHMRHFVLNAEVDDSKLDTVEAVLRAVDSFARSRSNLVKRTASWAHTSGSTTKQPGCEDSCAFLTPLGQWFNSSTSCHWHLLDVPTRLISSEKERIQKQLDQQVLHVRAIEHASTALGKETSPSARAARAALEAKYRASAEALKTKWEEAVIIPSRLQLTEEQKARRRAEEIAALLRIAVVTGFEVYCLRGSLAFIMGMHAASPLELFTHCYRRFQHYLNKKTPGYKPAELSTYTKDVCKNMLETLQSYMLRLNTDIVSLADVPGFYRHPFCVLFLCESALKYGTIEEVREATKIIESGVCFLTCKIGKYPQSLLNGSHERFDHGDDVQEDAAEIYGRADREHAKELKELKEANKDTLDAEEDTLASAGSSASHAMRMRQLNLTIAGK